MVKKMIAILLVFMMIFTIMIPTNAFAQSNDYIGHWAEDTIQTWLDLGYIEGYPDGSFKPEGLVKRAEFVTMVNSLFDFTEKSDITFTDVKPTDWYYGEVQKAFNAGYISGMSSTKFAPEDLLTREQAAIIVSNLMELEGNVDGSSIFTDSNKISDWAKEYVGATAEAKLIIGYDVDNTFRPQNNIKRAEAITILNRTMYYGPPTLFYAEIYEVSGIKYLYLLFDEEINVSKLFANNSDFSKLPGQVWGGAKVDLSSSDDFDDEIIIELAANTVLSNEISISPNSLIDASGEINVEISSSVIYVYEDNLEILNENIVTYVNEDTQNYIIETKDTVKVSDLLGAIKPLKEGYVLRVLDSNGNVVLNNALVNNSMVLSLFNESENIEKNYKISVLPRLSSNNISIVKEVDNEYLNLTVKNGATVGQVISSISSQTSLDSIQIIDYLTDKPMDNSKIVDENMMLYIEVGGWDYFYYGIIVE